MQLPVTPSFNLSGKTALVVGASSGIGLGAAVALAQAGAHAVVAARRTDSLTSLVEALTSEGYSAEALTLDISDLESTAEAVEKHGPFDILVNSAGLAKHSATTDTTVADYDSVTNVNVKAAYFLTQAVAKGLLAADKPGSLINISSQMAHVGGPERAVYCATKHAVEGFTKAMAIEWGSANIRVNTICPTFVLTDLSKVTFDDPVKRQWILDYIQLNRAAEVEDLMGPVVFLASDASAMITGTSLLVDGGWTAH
jgi:NAD(P)-dependent dehydrogenase (short-subunit alcohol dehydrogenase family)